MPPTDALFSHHRWQWERVEVDAGNWHCQRFGCVAPLLLHLQLNARSSRCRCSCSSSSSSSSSSCSCISASASVGTQKRNLKFSWLPFFEALSSLCVGDMAGWSGGCQFCTHRDCLTDWLTARSPAHGAYELCSDCMEQQEQEQQHRHHPTAK